MLHHQPIQNNAELSDISRRKLKNKGFLSFPNAEGFRSDELYRSKISKVPDREIYTVRKFRKQHAVCIEWLCKYIELKLLENDAIGNVR